MKQTSDWKDKQVLVLGAARQGLALARFLSSQGAHVILNDQHPEAQMESAIQTLTLANNTARQNNRGSIRWVFGEHPFSLLQDTSMVCVSGGVPLELPILLEAGRRNIPLSNDSQIFMEHVPCRVIGITGSAGKTTTTTLVGRMAQALAARLPGKPGIPRRAWVGGNIGLPLIDHLEEIEAQDLVILELSSFQLELMTLSPQVGAILNITPNHLDRHGAMEAYIAAKAHLLAFQKTQDTAILGWEDPEAWKLAKQVHGQLFTFGLTLAPDHLPGTYLRADGRLCFFDGQQETPLMASQDLKLRGTHNLVNVLAVFAILLAAGLPASEAVSEVIEFKGVAHRLELVREWKNIRWYNDSIASAPERTAAALRSFDEPIVLLLGGRDKKLPWSELAALIQKRVDHVILFGESAEIILHALEENIPAAERRFSIVRCSLLQEALQEAARTAVSGDVVLLSPGCTSYDEFKDFEERGEYFQKWINQLS